MKARLLRWRLRWRRLPGRYKLAVALAVIALAGLVWQDYTRQPVQSSTTVQAGAADDQNSHRDGGDGHAYGEYQPEPGDLADRDITAPVLDLTPEAARATVERFAANFVAGGSADEWFARISPDITAALQDQYRLTDIRNVPVTAVVAVAGPMTADTLSPTYRVDYADGSAVEVTTDMGVDGWKVSVVVPVQDNVSDPADPGAAPPAVPGPGDGQP